MSKKKPAKIDLGKGYTKKQRTSRWIVRPCYVMREGQKDCWCREIWTEDLRSCVEPAGWIRKAMCEYIVKLHNQNLEASHD